MLNKKEKKTFHILISFKSSFIPLINWLSYEPLSYSSSKIKCCDAAQILGDHDKKIFREFQ